ncbi:peptide chain release factor H [Actibacterium sp. 188UL27-1]|uniref:peptide chain release factor H n=1 Tax=Actibacterium sp. 188UL27-1 TaxID=2786961 RepID=UPI00195B94CD|nr:peptide chain release factor H [Actibacterium sp. 188UL27-1]MBM7066228.1 peptide chain release factor H [Actibacterium sp. 188UL27-1]
MGAAYLLLSSGNGPAECRLAVAGVLRRIHDAAAEHGLDVDIAERAAKHGPTSATIAVQGGDAARFAAHWEGAILWRHKSPLRPGHKRQNWFVGVFALPAPAGLNVHLDATEVRFESFRAGGPGGQHQNTTDSAVRAIWRNHAVVARDQRSQHRNKAAALARLRVLVSVEAAAHAADSQREIHHRHQQLQRGAPVRVFRGADFQEVT